MEVDVAAAPDALRTSRAVIALALTEARELLMHPVLIGTGLLGVLFTSLAILGFGESNSGVDETQLLSFAAGFSCLPFALGTFIAAHLVASHPQRSRARDLFDPTPMSTGQRTLASLLSVLAAAAVAAIIVGVSTSAMDGWDGLSVEFVGGRRSVTPTLAEMAQGPLIVLALGLAGVAVARVVPNPGAAAAMFALGVPQLIGVSWLQQGHAWWFAPMANHLRVGRWVDASPTYSYPVLEGLATSALGWHLVYLAGLVVVAAGLALVGSSWRRAGARATVVGVAVAILGGSGQLNAL